MFAEADMSMTQTALQQPGQQSRLYARFHNVAVQDKAKSLEEGRPIFVDKPYVEIRTPGDKSTVINRPVRDSDLAAFPQQWAAFSQGNEQVDSGTPLAEWPAVTRSQVEELAYFSVKTVEQLAGMSDTNIQKFRALTSLRQSARDYIESAKINAPAQQMREENEQLKGQMQVLQQQIQELQADAGSRAPSAGGTPRKRRA